MASSQTPAKTSRALSPERFAKGISSWRGSASSPSRFLWLTNCWTVILMAVSPPSPPLVRFRIGEVLVFLFCFGCVADFADGFDALAFDFRRPCFCFAGLGRGRFLRDSDGSGDGPLSSPFWSCDPSSGDETRGRGPGLFLLSFFAASASPTSVATLPAPSSSLAGSTTASDSGSGRPGGAVARVGVSSAIEGSSSGPSGESSSISSCGDRLGVWRTLFIERTEAAASLRRDLYVVGELLAPALSSDRNTLCRLEVDATAASGMMFRLCPLPGLSAGLSAISSTIRVRAEAGDCRTLDGGGRLSSSSGSGSVGAGALAGLETRPVLSVDTLRPADSLEVLGRLYGFLGPDCGAGTDAPLSSFRRFADELGSSSVSGDTEGAGSSKAPRSSWKESSAMLTRWAPRRRSLRRSARALRPGWC